MSTSNTEDSGITHDVYQAHRKNVLNKKAQPARVVTQDTPGKAIERLQKYATAEIGRENFTTINCAYFVDILHVCGFLSENHCIDSDDRVYMGLCALGRDRCYSAYRHNGNRDVFSEIAKLTTIGKTSLNFSKREAARVSIPIFSDVNTTKFGTSVNDAGLVHKIAGNWKIQTSHLNLYHALTGLKYIVEDEPDYFRLKDEPLFDDPLRVLIRANTRLNDRREQLESWMRI